MKIMHSLHGQKKDQIEYSILDTYLQMVFDEAIITHRLRILEDKINAALDSKDKPLFFELSTQYKKFKIEYDC